MSTTDTAPGNKSADQIEHEVEQTRANVSGTLDALRGKLAPSQMIDDVVDQVSQYVKGSGGAEFARNLGASVRDNPLPVLLIGAGIGWLLLSKGGNGHDRDDDRVAHQMPAYGMGGQYGTEQDTPGTMRKISDTVGQVTGAVRDAASDAVDYVKDAASRTASAASGAAGSVSGTVQSLSTRASEAAGTLREGAGAARGQSAQLAQRAADGWEEIAAAQPLLIGVLGLAVGAAIGAALPRSEAEDRLLGETRDAVVSKVSDVASSAYGDAREIVGEELDYAKQALSETYTRTKAELEQNGVVAAGDALGKAAKAAAETASDALAGITTRLAPDDRPDAEGRPRHAI